MMQLPMQQKTALFKVQRNETPEYGVIIEPMATGTALIRRGLCIRAGRRSFARATGVCLRLTDEGRAWIAEFERIPDAPPTG